MRTVKTAPASATLPINLDDVKQHLKIEDDIEDALLNGYLAAAVEWAEEVSRRAIAQQGYAVTADRFPIEYWPLPLGYVDSITQVEYIDNDGNTQVWDPAEYEFDNGTNYQARLRPARDSSWPSTGDYFSAAKVTMVAGFTPDLTPLTIRQAILLMTGNFYEGRAPGDPDGEEIERAASMLLSRWALPFIGI